MIDEEAVSLVESRIRFCRVDKDRTMIERATKMQEEFRLVDNAVSELTTRMVSGTTEVRDRTTLRLEHKFCPTVEDKFCPTIEDKLLQCRGGKPMTNHRRTATATRKNHSQKTLPSTKALPAVVPSAKMICKIDFLRRKK